MATIPMVVAITITGTTDIAVRIPVPTTAIAPIHVPITDTPTPVLIIVTTGTIIITVDLITDAIIMAADTTTITDRTTGQDRAFILASASSVNTRSGSPEHFVSGFSC